MRNHRRDDVEDGEDALDWEAVGRELLAGKLRHRSEGMHVALLEFADALEDGEDVTEADLCEVSEHAEMLLYMLGSIGAVPWDRTRDPSPEALRELLGDDFDGGPLHA